MKLSHKYIKALEAAGLTPKQARIYAAALSIGGGSVTALAHAAGLERSGLYYHLEDLVHRGYLKVSARGKRTIYRPADPDRIGQQLADQQSTFAAILPNLKQEYASQSATSAVTYYEGTDGIITLYKELELLLQTLTKKELLRVVSRSFEAVEALPDFIPDYMNRRAKMAVTTRIIQPQSERPPQTVRNSRDPMVRAKYNLHAPNQRYLPDRYLKGSDMGAVLILDDRVAMIDFKNGFASLTVNRHLTRTWQVLFDFMWDHLQST